jgi:hypothetical protein
MVTWNCVEQVLGLRVQAYRQLTDRLAAVRQERNRLVALQALGVEPFDQAPLGLGVVTAHETEALGRLVLGGEPLAHDDLKPPFGSGGLILGVNVNAIQAHDPRGSWPG